VARLNYGVITLLPKVSGDDKISQYRPICLLRCIYKLLNKTITIRLEPYIKKIIGVNQNAFMKKRSIIDDIISLHEIFHHTPVKKQVGIVLKLDFEKAFDKINSEFLIKCLEAMGFSDTLCGWIRKILHDGAVSFKINNVMGPYFKSSKGVR
jgi:hypothetical protein